MERLIEIVDFSSAVLVPVLALWAITCLYTLRSGRTCSVTECMYFMVLLGIAGVTIRTVMADDCCWLMHTASLSAMVIAGVLRRPAEAYEALV